MTGRAAQSPPVVVIGAGAAGMIAALFAARSGRAVVLIERTRDGGRKILASGGGRCNILPSRTAPERFVTDSSPNTLRNMLRSWPLPDQHAFLERELAMKLVLEEDTGKVFPETHRARDVRDGLMSRVRDARVDIRFDAKVTALQPPDAASAHWTVTIPGNAPLTASAIVLATGGKSVPATGSDGTGLGLAARLGHTIHETYPALAPLLASPHPHAHLSGVSLNVTIRAPGARPRFTTTGGFLFTHRGYSGPTVLDASHLTIRPGVRRQELLVQWTPMDGSAWEDALLGGRGTVGGLISRAMPARLAHQLLNEADLPHAEPLAHLTRPARRRLVRILSEYELPWTGNEGYRKAEVTGGGVCLAEVAPQTMESRRHRGLFLCGEILDAFGPIGGHNFQWAWATGRAAGIGAAAPTG